MTRTIVMKTPVDQEGDQLENINHVILSLLHPVDIDWRDEMTVEITLTGNFEEDEDGTLVY